MDILIDFDGTVVTHDYPEIGEDIGAVPILKKLIDNGHNLILFTMRSDDNNGNLYLSDAVNWFKKNDIPLYGVQKNPTQHTWTSSPKAYGQLIIDDTAIGCPLTTYYKKNNILSYRPFVNWNQIELMLIDLGFINK